jgi:hypothetical protein
MKTKEQKFNRKVQMQKISALVMGSLIATVIIIHLLHEGVGGLLNIIPLTLK